MKNHMTMFDYGKGKSIKHNYIIKSEDDRKILLYFIKNKKYNHILAYFCLGFRDFWRVFLLQKQDKLDWITRFTIERQEIEMTELLLGYGGNPVSDHALSLLVANNYNNDMKMLKLIEKNDYFKKWIIEDNYVFINSRLTKTKFSDNYEVRNKIENF
jgi:hypothetical protein